MRAGLVLCFGLFWGTIGVELVSLWFSFSDAIIWGFLDLFVFVSAIMFVIGLYSSSETMIYQGYIVGGGLLVCGSALNLGSHEIAQPIADLGVSAFTGMMFELTRRSITNARITPNLA